jgi:hypothetical protein
MLKIHCQGCGMSEEVDSSEHEIGSVSLIDGLDDRSWTKDPSFTTDLCRDCLAKLLHNYFGISAEGELALPAFIEPRSLRATG